MNILASNFFLSNDDTRRCFLLCLQVSSNSSLLFRLGTISLIQSFIRSRSDQSHPAIFWNPWSNKSEWWPPEGDNPWSLLFTSYLHSRLCSNKIIKINWLEVSRAPQLVLQFCLEFSLLLNCCAPPPLSMWIGLYQRPSFVFVFLSICYQTCFICLRPITFFQQLIFQINQKQTKCCY